MSELTLIFVGDLHGHLNPRPDLLGDRPRLVGGLARLYRLIQTIRARSTASLLVNAGDTIQGSAEVLFTRGEAIVSILNHFDFDAFAPGNWDYLYGTQRFLELFAGAHPRAGWHAIAANLYYDDPPRAAEAAGRVLPPYRIVTAAGRRVGLLGLTTHRGPQAVGPGVTHGFRFGDGDAELHELLPRLRDAERVDLVVLVSELGLARNIQLARAHPGIDVVLSSDTHELTYTPVVLETGTVLVEVGQDGMAVGELRVRLGTAGRVSQWTLHEVTDDLPEDPQIASLVETVQRPFLAAEPSNRPRDPFTGRRLHAPIDAVVGHTSVPLHRAGPSQSDPAAVVEGTAHDLIADALRDATGADVASLRGFRFGTQVAPGPIRVEDLYHFLPLGSQVAAGRVTGRQLRDQVEQAAHGCLSRDPSEWTGGWMFAYSGLRLVLDPEAARGHRARSIEVRDTSGRWEPLDDGRPYRYAALYHPQAPGVLNGLEATSIELVNDERGEPLDGVEVVARHLASLPGRRAAVESGRIRLARPLPAPAYGNPELQPLAGIGRSPVPSMPGRGERPRGPGPRRGGV